MSRKDIMRLTTIAASAAALALTAGGAAVAVADPGPHHGNNAYGLCTAYFAGSEKGQEEKRKAPPFQGLEAAAEEADQTVEEWCAENGTKPGNGGGKPE